MLWEQQKNTSIGSDVEPQNHVTSRSFPLSFHGTFQQISRKITMEPKHEGLEDDVPLQIYGDVNFRGCNKFGRGLAFFLSRTICSGKLSISSVIVLVGTEEPLLSKDKSFDSSGQRDLLDIINFTHIHVIYVYICKNMCI